MDYGLSENKNLHSIFGGERMRSCSIKKNFCRLVLAAVSGGFVGIVCGAGRTDLLHLSHTHRGGGKTERPDNTLETFMWCWKNGSAVECDCRRTKDGVGIMLHDETLKRTARAIPFELASKSVSEELTWNEIKDVDVGSYLSSSYADNRIPTIEATFAAIKGNPQWLCFVDEKGAGPEYIAKKAIEAGVQDQVYYTGPSHENIFKWNKILPGGKSLLWLGAWPKDHGPAERARADKWFRNAMSKLRGKNFKYISCVSIHSYYDSHDPVDPFVPSTSVLKDMIDEFHRHGIPVCSIPFMGGETEEVYFKLFELGCDGFSTDYPSVMFSVIRKLKAAD
jgi:glycerophosphoryl diester phosphodiesterase